MAPTGYAPNFEDWSVLKGEEALPPKFNRYPSVDTEIDIDEKEHAEAEEDMQKWSEWEEKLQSKRSEGPGPLNSISE